ncbi:MAG: hypothetical protein JW716_02065 [Candidatus Aenigmarchaeota archaeon]|nr:hypothetical protein [Candidatus Aenigmarchaeota archaeon]
MPGGAFGKKIGELLDKALTPIDVAVKMFIDRPIGYMTGHVFQRMDMHDAARSEWFATKAKRRFDNRAVGQGYAPEGSVPPKIKKHWGTNPISYGIQGLGGLPNVAKTGRFWDMARGSNTVKPRVGGAFVTGVFGILFGAFIQSQLVSIALGVYALSIILPGAESEYVTTGMGRQLMLWKGRTSSILKAQMQLVALVLGMYALYTSNLPFSALIMLIVGFAGYSALPVEFKEGRSDDFIKSFMRMFLGVVVLSIWVFGNLFQSTVLMFMGILFLAVPPIRRGEATDAIRSGGEDMFYKIIFLVGMVMIFLMVTGTLTIFGEAGWGLGQTSMLVFYLIWGMSFLSGLFSAVEDIPKIGTILLVVALILFGTTGPGGDAIGMAMFGQWWPTVENTMQNTLSPLGDMFGGLSNTFGSSYTMVTNPMGFATQIMDGGYAKNPDGSTGAYGLEISGLQADVIYPGAPFTIRFELNNKGVRDATLESLEIMSTLDGFLLRDENGVIISRNPEPIENDKKTGKEFFKWDYIPASTDMARGEIQPVFIIGEMTCSMLQKIFFDYSGTTESILIKGKMDSIANKLPKNEMGTVTAREIYEMDMDRLKGWADALRYISFRVRETYRYSTDSAMQIKFISDEKWRELSRDSKFSRSSVQSTMTTGPVKLNLGTMEQPIPAGTPFFVGFNLTITRQRTEINEAEVTLKLPFYITDIAILNEKCSVKPVFMNRYDVGDGTQGVEATWRFRKDNNQRSVFCYFDKGIFEMTGPEKTFTIEANASYSITSWENYDTRTSFQTACFGEEDYVRERLERRLLPKVDNTTYDRDPATNTSTVEFTTAIHAMCDTNNFINCKTITTDGLRHSNEWYNVVLKPNGTGGYNKIRAKTTIGLKDYEGNEFEAVMWFETDTNGWPIFIEIMDFECTYVAEPTKDTLEKLKPQPVQTVNNITIGGYEPNSKTITMWMTTGIPVDCISGCNPIQGFSVPVYQVIWTDVPDPVPIPRIAGSYIPMTGEKMVMVRDPSTGNEYSFIAGYETILTVNPPHWSINYQSVSLAKLENTSNDMVAGDSASIRFEPDFGSSSTEITGSAGAYTLKVKYKTITQGVKLEANPANFNVDVSGTSYPGGFSGSSGNIIITTDTTTIFRNLPLTDGQTVTISGTLTEVPGGGTVTISDNMKINLQTKKPEPL